MNPEIFIELSKILVVTVLVTGLIRLLKQPVIIGYILSGIVLGPVVLNIVQSADTLSAFSQIGVALLLFMVGLSLNPRVIKEVGKISLITGIGQVLFTASIGFLISKMLGFSTIVSLYISIALTFSSTIIIMKLLSDKKDLDTLYGRISIGFLIVQDFIAIAILLIISSLNNGVNLTSLAVETILKGFAGIIILFVVTIYVLPSLTRIIAKSQEFLLLFSLGWCFAIASVFYYFNFSIEAGALLAGISLSLSPYHFEISSKMKPLRDFFLIMFFIILGAQMIFSNIIQNAWVIIIFSLFVLIGNPLIVMTLMGLLGYTKRNSFLAGLTVAQISEFSLIVVAMGVSVGHVTNETLSLVTAVGLITFAGSTYMILYSNKMYPILSKYLTIFERKGKKVDEHKYHQEDKYDIILFGYNRIGFDILETLKKIKKQVLLIDFDPEVIANLSKEGYDCRYGDANDSELLNELNLSKAKMIISTIPLIDTNLLLINKVRRQNKKAIVAVVSHQIDEAILLYEAGATYVLMPHFLGGKHFSTLIEKNKLSVNKFLKEKIKHIEHLKHRKNLGHRHPTHEHK
jgi:Kef-type K+ transport system membrane component KefB/Trk K+ transport system NAD-binding subunit